MAIEAAKRNFSPEFMNRIDKVLVFHSLTREQLRQVLDIELTEFNDPAERWIDREQEGDGVGIDDHQIDEARRHHQDVVLEMRQQNQDRQQSQ